MYFVLPADQETSAVKQKEAKEAVSGFSSPAGDRYTPATSRLHGSMMINEYRIQFTALQKAFEIMGEELWLYGYKSGRRNDRVQSVEIGFKFCVCQYGVGGDSCYWRIQKVLSIVWEAVRA